MHLTSNKIHYSQPTNIIIFEIPSLTVFPLNKTYQKTTENPFERLVYKLHIRPESLYEVH